MNPQPTPALLNTSQAPVNGDDEPRYTPAEIATRLGKSGHSGRKFVLQEIRSGLMGCYDLTRKCKMVSENQYREYLESKRRGTVNPITATQDD